MSLSRKVLVASTIVLALFCVPRSVHAMKVGAGMHQPDDWATIQYFKDLFKQARLWGVLPASGNWDYVHAHLGRTDGPMAASELRADGYPKQVPTTQGQRVCTIMMANMLPQAYPFGTYTLMFEGTGEVYLGWDAGGPATNYVEGSIGQGHGITVTGSGGTTTRAFTIASSASFYGHYCESGNGSGILLHIMRSEASDPVHNIRVIMPDRSGGTSYVADHETQPFNPVALEDLRMYNNFRFMDWCFAFSSQISNWDDWPTLQTCGPARGYGFSGFANAYEWMCLLGNALHRDIWINLPYKATNDDFMRNMARVVHQTLAPDRTVYIEYANEIWNTAEAYLPQMIYLNGQAGSWGVSGWEQAQAYVSGKLFKAFRDEFGSESGRVVNVLCGFNLDPGLTSTLLGNIANNSINPTGVRADAFATAPYIYSNNVGTLAANAASAAGQGANHTGAAGSAGVSLITYEGGQHQVVGDVIGTNHDPQMYDVYTTYLNSAKNYFTMLQQYISHGSWGMEGAWGAKQYYG